jgi:hypothetical protein
VKILLQKHIRSTFRQNNINTVRGPDNVFDCRPTQRARHIHQSTVPNFDAQPPTLLLLLAAKLCIFCLVAKTSSVEQWRKSSNTNNTLFSRRVKHVHYDNTQSLAVTAVNKQFSCCVNDSNCWLIKQSGRRSRPTSTDLVPPPQSDRHRYTA